MLGQLRRRVVFMLLLGLASPQAVDPASHNFDDPSAKQQAIEANHQATVASRTRAQDFFRQHLER
jgi:dienelactone hydrolase